MNEPTPTPIPTPTPTPATDAILTLRPGWKQIVMVCKACEKRSKGPKKFGARKVARALSSALRQARQPKTRIVQTTCLGLCPKQAVAVAAAAPAGAMHVIAWRKADDAGDALRALLGQPVATAPSAVGSGPG